MSRPKAKWKVEYEAKVAAMSNAQLLEETLSNAYSNGSDQADMTDSYFDGVTGTELTRRLTQCGFLPPAPPVDPVEADRQHRRTHDDRD